jgi:hypothetical protein
MKYGSQTPINFTKKIPETVKMISKKVYGSFVGRRSNSPPSPINSMINQIIKSSYLSLYGAALLAQDNANLRMANEKIIKKCGRSTRQLPSEEGLTVEEALQLAAQLDLPVE